jgi:hypothetical protein
MRIALLLAGLKQALLRFARVELIKALH